MPYEIELNVDHLKRALEVVRRGVATPKQMLGSIGESLLKVNRDRHKAGVAPDGTKWKPLSPLTIGTAAWNKQNARYREGNSKRGAMLHMPTLRKVQARKSVRMLVESGDMLGSFIYQVRGDSVWLGFNGDDEAKKAYWHHNGTDPYTISPKKAKALSFGGIAVKRVHHPGLPKRELIGFPESDQQLVSDLIEDHLTKALRQAR